MEQARRVYRLSCVPQRHKETAKAGLNETNATWTDARDRVNVEIDQGGLVAVIGTPGTGKTQIAEQAVRFIALRHGGYCKYITAAEMFIEFRDCYRKDSPKSEGQVLREFTTPKLLLIDELDKIKSSDNEKRLLHLILDTRYREVRPSALFGNLDADGLREAIGDPCFERLVETGFYIELTGYSFRGE